MPYYVIALVLGIWLTVRKLDVSRREPEDFPNVERAGFERWKRQAQRAYTVGSLACFLKLVLDVALEYGAPRLGVPWRVIQILGGSLFFAWVFSLVAVWVMSARARRVQEAIGLELLPRVDANRSGERIPGSEEGGSPLERKEGGS